MRNENTHTITQYDLPLTSNQVVKEVRETNRKEENMKSNQMRAKCNCGFVHPTTRTWPVR